MTHHKSLSSSAHDGPCDCQYDCSLIEPIDTTQESLTLQCGWCGGGLLHHCGELTRLVKEGYVKRSKEGSIEYHETANLVVVKHLPSGKYVTREQDQDRWTLNEFAKATNFVTIEKAEAWISEWTHDEKVYETVKGSMTI